MGVIQSLASGFDLVTRHPDLMLLPILLDVFLWLGPRLSVYPLFRLYLDFVNSPEVIKQIGATQVQQLDPFYKLVDEIGQGSNLFWWLSPPLLGIPSLAGWDPTLKLPTGQPTVWIVSNVLAVFALSLVLGLIGLALLSVYWGLISSRVRAQAFSLGRVTSLWWGLFKIAILWTIIGAVVGLPTALVATPIGLLNPVAGQCIVMMGGSLILWAFFYMAFTVHGMALRDAPVIQSVRVSITLVRFQFLSAMGLIIVSVAIYFGTGLLWTIPASDSWIKAAGILGHAFTATGLLTATALFYMDRTKPVASPQGAAPGQ